MPTTLLALHPQGAACGGADKMHAPMKGLARVGAARPGRHCSPEPDVSGDCRRQTNMQLQRNQKGFPLCKVPFKNANCRKCCRS